MKRILIILCIVALLAVAAGCSQPAPAPQSPATPEPTPVKVTTRATSPTYLPTTTVPVPTNAPSVSDNTITIRELTFNPSQITVKAGAYVRWVNEDSVIHRIKFADNSLSPLLAVGQSYTRAFDKPGVYDYTCAMYPRSMLGTITVE